MSHVVRQKAQVETGLAQHLEVRVLLRFFDVLRARIPADLAFAGLEFLQAGGGVGIDREDQVVELHVLRLPVFRVADVTDLRVFLIALEHERPCTDRLQVDVASLALLDQLCRIFSRLNRGEAHRQILDERGINVVQLEADGLIVDLFDLLDGGVHAHVSEVRRLGRVRLAERVIRVQQAVEGEQHVIGVEVAGRFEIVRGVEFHARPQVKGVGQAVVGHVPLGCQARLDVSAAALELGQAIEDGLC